MWYVYILRSDSDAPQRYIGRTSDLEGRIADHHAGRSPHASKYAPWQLETVIGFDNKSKAVAFGRYLKSGSGFAFAKRNFCSPLRATYARQLRCLVEE